MWTIRPRSSWEIQYFEIFYWDIITSCDIQRCVYRSVQWYEVSVSTPFVFIYEDMIFHNFISVFSFFVKVTVSNNIFSCNAGCTFGDGDFYELGETWHPNLGYPFGEMVCVDCDCVGVSQLFLFVLRPINIFVSESIYTRERDICFVLFVFCAKINIKTYVCDL